MKICYNTPGVLRERLKHRMIEPEQSQGQPTSRVAGRRASRLMPQLRLGWARLGQALTRESSVAEGSALLIAAFLLSAVLGVVRQILLNARFGTGMEASAYYAASRLPETISTLLAGGTLANALIPVLFTVLRDEGREAVQRFASLVISTLTAFIVPLVLALVVFTPAFVRYVLAPGFDPPTNSLTVTLTRLMLLELLLVSVNGVALALFYSRNQFVLPVLAIALRNVALISGIVAAMFYPPLGIYGPTLGTIADALIQLAILLPGLRHAGYRYRPAWNLRDRHLRAFIRLLIPNGLSGAVNYAGTIADTAFASLSRQAAAIPALVNAFLLIGVPTRLLGLALAQAAFPRLAARAAAEDWPRMRRTLIGTLTAAMGLGGLAALALALVGRPMVALLFERGRFDAAAGDLTTSLFVVYLVALPAYTATEVLTRGLIALCDTRTPLITNCLQLGGRIALTPFLLPSIDVLAIPVAFAVTSTLEALILGGVLAVKLRRREV